MALKWSHLEQQNLNFNRSQVSNRLPPRRKRTQYASYRQITLRKKQKEVLDRHKRMTKPRATRIRNKQRRVKFLLKNVNITPTSNVLTASNRKHVKIHSY